MDRPISPSTVLDTPFNIESDTMDTLDTLHSTGITIENIQDLAREGFQYLITKLDKTSLTPGDALLAFYNYDENNENNENNENIIMQLFCLSLCMLDSVRNSLNEIEPDTYQKLLNYTVDQFNSKLTDV